MLHASSATATADNERRIELLSAVLLALAAVATAWSAYQSREWTGEQALDTSHATAARITENRLAALANRQVQIDVATFVQWIDARAEDRPRVQAFYRSRFRPEFEPAFAAWLAARPFDRGGAPPTPFAMPQYRLRATADAARQEATAAADSEDSKAANRNADTYMLGVVLFACSLFFAGLSSKLHTPAARRLMLGVGCLVFLGGVVWIATLPVQVTT